MLAAEEKQSIDARIEADLAVLEAVWAAISDALQVKGLAEALETVDSHIPNDFSIARDPYDQSESLLGIWRGPAGNRLGEIQIRDNGKVYAEFDVIQNHPTDKRWFVESITAWGSGEEIKTELQLIAAV